MYYAGQLITFVQAQPKCVCTIAAKGRYRALFMDA